MEKVVLKRLQLLSQQTMVLFSRMVQIFLIRKEMQPQLLHIPDSNVNGTATVTVSLQDDGGTDNSGIDTLEIPITVTVTTVNDAPTITPPSSQTIDEDNTLSFVGGTQIALADIDVGSDDVTITLGVGQGTLTMSTIDGLTFATGDGSEDADIVFSGTLTAAQSALDSLVYTPTSHYNGADTLSIAIADGGSTGTGGEQSDSRKC